SLLIFSRLYSFLFIFHLKNIHQTFFSLHCVAANTGPSPCRHRRHPRAPPMSIAKPPCLPFAGERHRRYMQWFRRPSAAGPAAVSSSDEAVDPLQPLSSPLGRRSPPDLLSPAPGRGLFLKYSSCFLGSPTLQKCTASLGVCWIQTPKAM
ncbi:hypothetical protein LINPERHAP1_LOCUS34708, partial [Linum perenne]